MSAIKEHQLEVAEEVSEAMISNTGSGWIMTGWRCRSSCKASSLRERTEAHPYWPGQVRLPLEVDPVGGTL